MSQTTGFPPISLSFFLFFQLCLSLGVDIVNMGVSIVPAFVTFKPNRDAEL